MLEADNKKITCAAQAESSILQMQYTDWQQEGIKSSSQRAGETILHLCVCLCSTTGSWILYI